MTSVGDCKLNNESLLSLRVLGEILMFRRLFSLEGKIRVIFVACDLRKESSERTGDEMIVTVEELKRLEDTDIRDLRREDLDNAGDIVIDRQKSANQRMREFLEKTKNPYAENVGEYILQVTYSKTSEETLEDKMIQLAKRMTRIPL